MISLIFSAAFIARLSRFRYKPFMQSMALSQVIMEYTMIWLSGVTQTKQSKIRAVHANVIQIRMTERVLELR